MSSKDEFDDDYVAKLLAEDAKKTSSKYASQGLSAFLPKKRAADAPKPNTRFLSHIVREADSHNAALKRKEELEAERRLRALRENDERPAKRRRADETDASKRSRMFKDILGAAKSERPSDERRARRSSHDKVSDHRRSDDKHSSTRDKRHSRHARSRSRSPDERKRHARRRNSSSASGSERTSRRKLEDKNSSESNHRSKAKRISHSPDEKPIKEVRVRGRGAHKHRSAMDEHFKDGYDPSQDVSLDSDHNSDAEDWDLALEAMRDRAKYKQSQASRMRDAGFSEEDISKWEKGSFGQNQKDGDISAVKWSQKGEIREWDAGK